MPARPVLSRLAFWIQASRPLSQVNIAVPLLYGQALAYAVHHTFRWKLFFLVQLFGVLDQLFIVFANDAADWQSDSRNATYNRFSGGSRVVPEGKIPPFHLAQASLVMLLSMGAVSLYLVFREGRAWTVVLTAIAAHLMWAYSYPPFRLSYRGHGEVLQGIGLGLLLPVFGFYVQANTLEGLQAATLFPAFLLGYAGNVTTALADTPSDAATGKRSFSVRRGERAARRTSVALLAIAALATPLAVPGGGAVAWIGVLVVAVALLSRSVPLVPTADAVNREACERFVFWNGATIQAVLLAWAAALVLLRA